MNSKDRWTMRERGIPLPQLQERLQEAIRQNIDYGDGTVLGFPGTLPIPEAVSVLADFAATQANNIGVQTLKVRAEAAFKGTQDLEREFIYAVGRLAGAADPAKEIDGYICSGGTEGNDAGMWLGRNALLRTRLGKNDNDGIAVLTSFLSHYSIIKHFGRLFQGNPRNRFQELPTDSLGEVTGIIVEETVRSLFKEGYRRFLVIPVAGATNLGSVDHVDEICATLRTLGKELGIKTYVHVDAAFGGFILPFLEPNCHFGFHSPLVKSMCLDAHKMGFAPYPAGVFLCRKRLLGHIRTRAKYLSGHSDFTVSGSRSGAVAAACWTLLNTLGRLGYRDILLKCMENRNYLHERLERLNAYGRGNVYFYPEHLNILTVRFSPQLVKALKHAEAGAKSIEQLYCIPTDKFPKDFGRLTYDKGGRVNRMEIAHRFTAMPHYERAQIDAFVAKLEAVVSS